MNQYDPRNYIKDHVRVFHRMESEVKPGTIEIIDSSGELVEPEKLEYMKKTQMDIVVIDIVTTANSELFT